MKILDCIFATRPMLQIPVWSVYLVSLHYHQQLSGRGLDLDAIAILAGLTMLASGAFLVNQVYDLDTDRWNNKVGFLQKGIFTEREMLITFSVLSISSLLIGSFVSSYIFRLFMVLLAVSYLYSVPPARLKDRAIPGLLANMFGHGFLISIAVLPNLNMHNVGLIGWDSPFYFALTVGGIYTLTTIPDIEGDRMTGKKTISTEFGKRSAILLAMTLQALAALVAYYSDQKLLLVFALFAAILPIVALSSRRSSLLFSAIKLPVLMLTLCAAWFYPGFMVFLVVLLITTRAYYRTRFGLNYPTIV